MDIHREVIENMWDYRYWKYVDYAMKTKDWLKVFAFLGEFKAKCLQLAKYLVSQKFNHREIDNLDHRYESKR